MLQDKINSLLRLKNTNINAFCRDTNQSQPNYSQKAKKNSYYLKDAIMIADYTNTKLAFLDENNQPIVILSSTDIKK